MPVLDIDALFQLLQTGRGYNTDHLARDCGVCQRTIFRDLEIMREAGVPLVHNRQEQRYHIPGTYFLPPTNFTPEEALALIVLCHDLGGRRRLPFFEAARNAAIKLESSPMPNWPRKSSGRRATFPRLDDCPIVARNW